MEPQGKYEKSFAVKASFGWYDQKSHIAKAADWQAGCHWWT